MLLRLRATTPKSVRCRFAVVPCTRPQTGVYPDRIAGGDRYHCHPGGDVAAGLEPRETESAADQMHFQPPPDRAGHYGVPAGQ